MPKLSPDQATMRNSFLRAVAMRDDPVFPAIAAHRASWKAYSTALSRREPDAKLDALYSTERARWEKLLRTVPTTTFGAAALARHVSRYRQITCEAAGPWEIRSLLKALRNVAVSLKRAGGANV